MRSRASVDDSCWNCNNSFNVAIYFIFAVAPFVAFQAAVDIYASSWTFIAVSLLFISTHVQVFRALFRPIGMFAALLGLIALISLSVAFTVNPPVEPLKPSNRLAAPDTGTCSYSAAPGYGLCTAATSPAPSPYIPAAAGPFFRPAGGYFPGVPGFARTEFDAEPLRAFTTDDLDLFFADFNSFFLVAGSVVSVEDGCRPAFHRFVCQIFFPTCDADCGIESVTQQVCFDTRSACASLLPFVGAVFTSPIPATTVSSSMASARVPSYNLVLSLIASVTNNCTSANLSPAGRRSGQTWTGVFNRTQHETSPVFARLVNSSASCSPAAYAAYLAQSSSSSAAYDAALAAYRRLDVFQRRGSFTLLLLLVACAAWLELLVRYGAAAAEQGHVMPLLAPADLQWTRLVNSRRLQLVCVFAIGCISIVICFYLGFSFDVHAGVSSSAFSVIAFLICVSMAPFMLRNFFALRETDTTDTRASTVSTMSTIALSPMTAKSVATPASPPSDYRPPPGEETDGAATEAAHPAAKPAAEAEGVGCCAPLLHAFTWLVDVVLAYRQLYRETFGYNGTYVLYKLVLLECVEIALQLASLQDASSQTHTVVFQVIVAILTVNMVVSPILFWVEQCRLIDIILFDLTFDTFYNCFYLFAYNVSDMTAIRFVSVIFTCLSSVQTLIDVAIYMQYIDDHKSQSVVSDELAARFKNVAHRELHFGQVRVDALRYLFHAFGVVSLALGVLLLAHSLSTMAALDAHCGALLGSGSGSGAWLRANPRVYFTSDAGYATQAPGGVWTLLPNARPTCRFEMVTRWDVSGAAVSSAAMSSWPLYLTSLNTLIASSNGLSSLPLSWKNVFWPSLKTLDLSNNQLSYVSPSFFNSSVQSLFLSGNPVSLAIDWSNHQLQSLPPLLTSLKMTLLFLNVSNNSLSEIDSAASKSVSVLSQLCQLSTLDVSYNELSSSQLSSVSCLQRTLKRVDLSHNNLVSFQLSPWTNLAQIDLSFNKMTSVSYYDLFGISNLSISLNIVGNPVTDIYWTGGVEADQYCQPGLLQLASTVLSLSMLGTPVERLSPLLPGFSSLRQFSATAAPLTSSDVVCAFPRLAYLRLTLVRLDRWPLFFSKCYLNLLKTIQFGSTNLSTPIIPFSPGLTTLSTVIIQARDVASLDACLQTNYGFVSSAAPAFAAAAESLYGVACRSDVNLRVLCGLKCPATARAGVLLLLPNVSVSLDSSVRAAPLSTPAELSALYPVDPLAYIPEAFFLYSPPYRYPYPVRTNASRLIAPALNATFADTIRWDRAATRVTTAGFRGALSPWGVSVSADAPLSFPMNAWCEWSLQAPVGRRINLTFAFMDLQVSESSTASSSLPCYSSYVNIFDGANTSSAPLHMAEAPLYGHLCHVASYALRAFVSSGNVVTVRFVGSPDASLTDVMNGFMLEWLVW